jgi:phosphotransferase system enzyme I (PtsI)
MGAASIPYVRAALATYTLAQCERAAVAARAVDGAEDARAAARAVLSGE